MEIKKVVLHVPVQHRRGESKKFQEKSILSGYKMLLYIQQNAKTDLSTADILDFGCGVKFTQAILQFDIPIKSYFGVDVSTKMIDYLKANVSDGRFKFETVPFFNEMYNRKGEKMTATSSLPVKDKKFDLITLQSVFSHFNPTDLENALQIFERYLNPNGKIFFTCFVEESLPENFIDENPDKPLLRALYKKEYLDMLIHNAGYQIDFFASRKLQNIGQDHYVCSLRQ